MRSYSVGVLLLLITNMLDVFYTHKVLSEGIAVEANPLMLWVITNHGFDGLTFVKLVAIAAIWGLLLAVHKKLGRVPELVSTLFWGSVVAYITLTMYHLFIQATL